MPLPAGTTSLSELGVAFHARPEARPTQPKAVEKPQQRPENIQKHIDRARALKEQGSGSRDILRELGRNREFPLQTGEFDELKANLPPESKKTVQELQDFSTYAEVQRELQKGKSLAEILKDRNMTPDEWNDSRKNVLSRITGTDVIQQIPGLSDLTPEQQLDHVETFLVSDPELRNAVIKNVRATIEKADAIPEAPPPQSPTAEKQKTLTAQQTETFNRIKIRLGETGSNLTLDQIKTLLNGRSIPEVTLDLFDTLLQQNGVANPGALRSYASLQKINTEITSLEAQVKSPNTEAANAAKAKIAELQGQKIKAESEYKATGVPESALQNQMSKYQELEKSVYGQKDPLGRMVGGIEGDLNNLSANTNELRSLESQAQRSATPEQQRQEQSRLLEQQKVAHELTQVMEKSVTEVLLQRHNDLVERQAIESEAQAIEAEKDGKINLEKGLRTTRKAKDNNWIKYNPETRKFDYQRENIGQDMKYLAEQGDEGLRRLLLRDLSGSEGVISLIPPATWDNVQWEQLPEENRQLLNEINDKQGGAYLDNLFSSYYIANTPQGIRDAIRLGQSKDIFRPKGDQFKRLTQLFGDHIKAGSEKAKQFQQIGQELKQKGINPESSMGFLFTIAALLGGFKKKEEGEYSEG